MTNSMLKDLVKSQKLTIKRLIILAIVLGVICLSLFIFVLTNYEVVYEEIYQDEEYTVEQDSADGGNNTAIIDSEVNANNDLFTICGTVIVCAIIITGGVILYGKTKNHN